jgi:hypothetical protein
MLLLWTIGCESSVVQFGPFKHSITCCQFDQTEDLLAFGTSGGSVSMIDLDQNRTRQSWLVPDAEITCIAFPPLTIDSLAVGDNTGMVYILSCSYRLPIQIHDAHSAPVCSVSICPSGHFLATTGGDHLIRLFDLDTGNLHGTIHPKCDCTFLSVEFHPIEEIIAVCAEDRGVKIFDIHRIRELKGGFVIGQDPPSRITFSQDGEVVVAASSQTLSVFKTTSADHTDHIRLNFDAVMDLKVYDRCVVLGTVKDNNAGLLICGTDEFQLLLKKKRKKKPKKRFPSPGPIPAPAPEPEPAPVRRILDKPVSPPANDAVYRAFREGRPEYVALMTQRLGRYGRLKELLATKGLKEAATGVATSGDSAPELVSVLLAAPEVVTMENAAAVLEVVHVVLKSDEESALTLLRIVLRDLGPVIKANVGSSQAQFYHQSIDILNGLREFHSVFEDIKKSGSPGVLIVRKILSEWQSFFK